MTNFKSMQILAIAAAFTLGGCLGPDGREIDDGGRSAREMFNAPVAGPASNDSYLAEPWRVADGPIPGGGDDRSAGEQAAAEVCDAERWSVFMGATENDLASARRMPDNFRMICFECAVTQDHQPDRVNFYMSQNGRVERVTCG